MCDHFWAVSHHIKLAGEQSWNSNGKPLSTKVFSNMFCGSSYNTMINMLCHRKINLLWTCIRYILLWGALCMRSRRSSGEMGGFPLNLEAMLLKVAANLSFADSPCKCITVGNCADHLSLSFSSSSASWAINFCAAYMNLVYKYASQIFLLTWDNLCDFWMCDLDKPPSILNAGMVNILKFLKDSASFASSENKRHWDSWQSSGKYQSPR